MVELVSRIEPRLLARLVELEQAAFGAGGMNEWHLVPIIRHGRVFVSRNNAEVLGAVQYILDWERPELAYMVGVSVAAEARGQGIGTGLITQSLNRLFADKIAEVELTVEANNAAAIKVYKEKLGFEITGFRENEYGQGEDRLVMILTRDRFKSKLSQEAFPANS
ncbi:GNAT family N-acetyltransferase [Sporomusa aerivorans]|uniref:GNAT family N-acetyltransferase n=1 Tax=Sporomusa aerivorans TaxID=204936 RepID=UPI00352A7B97